MVEFKPILPQGACYAIVIKSYQREIMTAEEFATAGRTVKTGLVASTVVSSWI